MGGKKDVKKDDATQVTSKEEVAVVAVEEEEPIRAPLAHFVLLVVVITPVFTHVWTDANIVITAALTVYVGCQRSVKNEPVAETMTKEDAMRFPFVGSLVLFSLFMLFKYLPKELVNAVLTCYLVLLGVIALTATMLPFINILFPEKHKEHVFRFGNLKIPYFVPEPIELSATPPELLGGFLSTLFCIWYFARKHFLANNLLGIAFSLKGIEFLSVGSVKIGAILLCGLFVYDIFWVFCTPVMVTVAKSFDAPIKLLFPRFVEAMAETQKPFSLLGLGDIVVPGIFVAIMLRYDVFKENKGHPYFHSAFAGYTVGLITTICVMNWFKAAQPALLYIVPGVLIGVAACAAVRGDSKELLEYEESSPISEGLEELAGSGEAAAVPTKKEN